MCYMGDRVRQVQKDDLIDVARMMMMMMMCIDCSPVDNKSLTSARTRSDQAGGGCGGSDGANGVACLY